VLAQGQQGADVGDKLRVKLIKTDLQRIYIDLARDRACVDSRTAA
jgi:hypothetical protein